jgi:type IV secretion system protein VirB11
MKPISSILQKLLKDLKPYLDRKDINEIIINTPNLVMLDLGNEKWEFKKNTKINESFLDTFPKQLATYSNQQFDEKNIYLSSAIPGTNNRVGVVHSSILQSKTNSNEINIRIQKNSKFQLSDFTNKTDFHDQIQEIVQSNSNILISGATGSGKTALFNTLVEFIPDNHRIVTLEDSPELNPKHKNLTQLLVSKNGTSLSGTTYEDMINICMRLRPTNLLLGEIDTRNTAAFLRLANTGHDGMISTLHANSTLDSVQAIVSNLTYSGSNLSLRGMYNFILSAIDYVIQIKDKQIVDVSDMKTLLNKSKGE